jgi:hypothetical protein
MITTIAVLLFFGHFLLHGIIYCYFCKCCSKIWNSDIVQCCWNCGIIKPLWNNLLIQSIWYSKICQSLLKILRGKGFGLHNCHKH